MHNFVLSPIDTDVLIKNISDRITENILNLVAKEKEPTAQPDELLTIAEVCTLLKVTRGALHNYKKKGLIPAHRLGAKVRFKKSEVLAALHSIKAKRG